MWLLIASLCYVSTRPFASGCTAGEVRLVGGDNQYGGRVEYCSDDDLSVWMPVCDSTLQRWTDFEAGLACNATGLPGIINATTESCANTILHNEHDNSLAFDCAQTAASFADCGTSIASACYSAMATCIVENPCDHLNCPNNSICMEGDYDPSNCYQKLCPCNNQWTGKNCDQVLCDPPCADGRNCTAPNICQYTDGTQSEPGNLTTLGDLSPASPSATQPTELLNEDAGTDYTIIIGALSSVGTLLGIAASLAVSGTIVLLVCRKRKRTRQADISAETPPICGTDSLIVGSLTIAFTPTASNAPQLGITQEAISLEQSRKPWVYEEDTTPHQKETVQSAIYQSAEFLNLEMSIGSPAWELKPTGATENALIPNYIELNWPEENACNSQMETVESQLYQSVEELQSQCDF